MNDTHTYNTSDLHLAAFLRVAGLRLLDVQSSNGKGRATFIFADSTERERLVLSYRNQQASVEPMRYVEVWKSLKAQAGAYS